MPLYRNHLYARLVSALRDPKPSRRCIRGLSPWHRGKVLTNVPLNKEGKTGIYYDEKGHPMQAPALVRDPHFRSRVVAETRALVAENSK